MKWIGGWTWIPQPISSETEFVLFVLKPWWNWVKPWWMVQKFHEISRSHQKLVSCLPKYWTLPMMLLVLLNGTIFVVSFPGFQSPGQWFVPESGAGLVRRDQTALGGERSESLRSAGDRLWTSLRWLQLGLGVEIVMQWFMQWFWGFEKNGLGSKIFRILLVIKGNHGNWGYPNFRKHPRHWELDENGQS